MKAHKCSEFFMKNMNDEDKREFRVMGYCKVCNKRTMKVYSFKGFFDRDGKKIK